MLISRRRWLWIVAGAPWVPSIARSAPAGPTGPTSPTSPTSPTGPTGSVGSVGSARARTADLEIFDWTFSRTTPFAHRAVVLVPTHLKAGEKVRTVVLLHGLGEAIAGAAAGVYAWIDKYGLGTSYSRLRSPPVASVEKNAFLMPARAAEITTALQKQAFPGLVLVCPYVPNVWGMPIVPALDALARFITGDLLAKVESDIDVADTRPVATAIDGCSLGGFASLEVFQRYPARFGAIGVIQPAIRKESAPGLAAMMAAAHKAGTLRAAHIESSSMDPYLEPSNALAAELTKQGVPSSSIVPPGHHDQEFLRDVGTLEMLLWHGQRP